DQQFEFRRLSRHVRPYDSCERIAVGDGQGGIAQLGGSCDQLVGVRSAREKGEIGLAMNFGVAKFVSGTLFHHSPVTSQSKEPCKNHCPSRSWRKTQRRFPRCVATT